MNVDKIYINTYKYDYLLLRICVASIRYWYKEIPIFLIKDVASGAFNTEDLKKKYDVQIFSSEINKYGWGFGKLEPLFLTKEERFLILDSDTVITGKIIEQVNIIEADFVVDKEVQLEKEVNRLYYKLDKIQNIIPEFEYPGYTFNTGQWFGVSNRIYKKDFEAVLEWKVNPVLKYPDVFQNGDQGVFNMVIQLKEAKGEITVERKKFMVWPKYDEAKLIDLNQIRAKKSLDPKIIHWAGLKHNKLRDYERADILQFYLHEYLKKLNILERIQFRFLSFFFKNERKVKYKMSEFKKKGKRL